MFGRGEKWWVRELERRERAWSVERASLVATICHLAGKPLPSVEPWEPEPDEAQADHDFTLPDFH